MKKIIFLILTIFIFCAHGYSQYTGNTAVNLAVCDTTGDQATPKIASTSDGGCYIAWFDNRTPNYPLYLQRLDAAGNKKFGKQGLLISNHPQNTSLQDFNIDVDVANNVVIVFTDRRNGPVLNPIAYLISFFGAFLWGPNGVSLTDSTTIAQNIPVVTTTSDGNYVFAWSYGASAPLRIAMQKLNAAGVPQWGSNPIKISSGTTENYNLMRLIESDAGSVIMSWDGYTGNLATTITVKINIQKFSSAGAILWTSPFIAVQSLGRAAGISFPPYLTSDGQDGAVIAFQDDRDANARASVWVQRYNSAGVNQFPVNGSEGTSLSTNQHFAPSATYLASTQETIMFWHETNGGQTVQGGLYGQKFDATGNIQWGANGNEFKAPDNNQLSFISAYSKDTSVVVSYTESLFGSANAMVLAMKTGPSSMQHWAGDTLIVSSSLGGKIRKQAILDKNSGQSVMTWSNGDIIAQNIKFNGDAGVCILNGTVGIEGMWDGVTQVQDTMRLYMRNNTSPYASVDSAIVYLNSAGNNVVGFANAASGNYYIQTKHRNALEIWSGSAQSFTVGSQTAFDFTTSQSQTFGNNSVLKSGKYCAYSGDVLDKGNIDVTDVIAVFNDASNFVSGYVDTDVNGDNFVDVTDMLITYNNAVNFISVIRP